MTLSLSLCGHTALGVGACDCTSVALCASISMGSADFWFFLSGEAVSFVGLRIRGPSALLLLPLMNDVIRWLDPAGTNDFLAICASQGRFRWMMSVLFITSFEVNVFS